MKKLLTVSNVADLLSISKSLVYDLVERGDLPCVSVGKSKGYRFDPDDVRAFTQQRKTKNGGKPSTKTSRPQLKHIKL